MKTTLLGIILLFGLGIASHAQTAAGNPNKKKNKKKAAAALVPKGGDRHIYKKIGDVELPLYVYKPEKPKAGEWLASHDAGVVHPFLSRGQWV